MLLSESEMDSVMRAFDHNRNGKVDFLEFYGQLARHRPARDAAPLHRFEPSLGPHSQQEPRRRLCIHGRGPLAIRLRVLLCTSENMPSSDAGGQARR